MSQPLDLTPNNFPSIFTHIPNEQLVQAPRVNMADLIPGRYYFQTGTTPDIVIVYIHNNNPQARTLLCRYVYERHNGTWFECILPGHTYCYNYNDEEFDVRYYDLTTGFHDSTGQHIQLNSDDVKRPSCISIYYSLMRGLLPYPFSSNSIRRI